MQVRASSNSFWTLRPTVLIGLELNQHRNLYLFYLEQPSSRLTIHCTQTCAQTSSMPARDTVLGVLNKKTTRSFPNSANGPTGLVSYTRVPPTPVQTSHSISLIALHGPTRSFPSLVRRLIRCTWRSSRCLVCCVRRSGRLDNPTIDPVSRLFHRSAPMREEVLGIRRKAVSGPSPLHIIATRTLGPFLL